MRIEYTQDVEVVRELAGHWLAASAVSAFGFDTDIEDLLDDLRSWINELPGTLVVAYGAAETPVALFALFVYPNILHGASTLAIEKYWYALPNAELAGVKVFRAGWQWAKSQGCTHLVCSASRLMPHDHDRIARFCRSVGMQPLESTFIREIA